MAATITVSPDCSFLGQFGDLHGESPGDEASPSD
jgi:hypothetical protein